ncbi:hypothetical protein [Nocardia sp. NPDC049707]|uniref:hypothetical protein n=1 Tax=Nocardia sp. NPDC049707 TaxID=3154735 RepID=UPI00343C34FF
MIAGLVAGVLYAALVVLVSWWLDVLGRTESCGRHTRSPGRSVIAADAPRHTDAPPRSQAPPTTEWADPAQVWVALDAENVLLAALLSGRIGQDEYRARLFALARGCEPASDGPAVNGDSI